MAAECLPDELWRRILELGTLSGTLTYRDLCCLSISARRMRRLSGEGSLWSILLASDFLNNGTSATTTKTTAGNGSWKTVYRIRYEKDREKKKAAHRRAMLRLESVMAQCKMELKRLKEKREEEMGKLKVAVEELSRLEKVRQASVALNVWQPEVVRGRQKQIVEQCSVPVESRINTLQMEVKLCRLQIVALDRSHRDQQRRLERAREELASMEYHPLRDYSSAGSMISSSSSNIYRKKLKRKQDDAGNQGCSSLSSMYGYG